MTPPGGDTDYYPYSMTLAEALDLPKREEISPNITEYNTNRKQEAIRIIRETARKGERIEINGRHTETDMMEPFMANPGHTPGINAQYFLDDLRKFTKARTGRSGQPAIGIPHRLVRHC